jgi:hypothetical protein
MRSAYSKPPQQALLFNNNIVEPDLISLKYFLIIEEGAVMNNGKLQSCSWILSKFADNIHFE